MLGTRSDKIKQLALLRSATPLRKQLLAKSVETNERSKDPDLQGLLEAGATGLEPATSGVTAPNGAPKCGA
jgi:hypothetical protein